jgi:hypothetical protein
MHFDLYFEPRLVYIKCRNEKMIEMHRKDINIWLRQVREKHDMEKKAIATGEHRGIEKRKSNK